MNHQLSGQNKQFKILFLRLASYYSFKSPHPENCMMPIDLSIMMSMAKEFNFLIDIIDTEADEISENELSLKIKNSSPDFIVLKAKSPSAEFIISFFAKIKVPIWGVGQAFITDPDYFFKHLPNLKAVLPIEPEFTFKQFLYEYQNNKNFQRIEGLIYRTVNEEVLLNPPSTLCDNLDSLPKPSFEYFQNSNYVAYYPSKFLVKKKFGFMLTSRGCPLQCIFCSPTLRQSAGPSMRFHSIERVIDEIKTCIQLDINTIYFRDDIFTINRERTIHLCQAIHKEKIKIMWMAQTHINFVDEELLKTMKDAGCVALGFGIETGSSRLQTLIKKNIDINHAKHIFKFMKKIGLNSVGFFQLGIPTESKEELELTQRLIKELSPTLIQIAFFTPYAGSEFHNKLARENITLNLKNFHHYNKNIYNYSQVSNDEIRQTQIQIYKSYLLSPRTILYWSLDFLTNLPLNFKMYRSLLLKVAKLFFFRDDKNGT